MIDRKDVIKNAEKFINVRSWTPKNDTYVFTRGERKDPFHSCFIKGKDYTVIPYVYGGSGSAVSITSKIETKGICPGGWDRASGWGTSHWYGPSSSRGKGPCTPGGGGLGYGHQVPQFLAGIDCSAYVSTCWKTKQRKTTTTLPTMCLKIDRSSLRPGDILNKICSHVRIFSCSRGSKIEVYEALGGEDKTPEKRNRIKRPFNNDEFGCVVRHTIDWDGDYVPYSPFPQFYRVEPAGKYLEDPRPTFRIEIKGSGEIELGNFEFDNRCIVPQIKGEQNHKKITYTPNYDLGCGRYRLGIQATNTIAGQTFRDEDSWEWVIE